MKEIVTADITSTKPFIATTVNGGVVFSDGTGGKVTATLSKGVADAIKTQTGATVSVKETKVWSGDRHNVKMIPLKCTTKSPSVEAEGSLELTFEIDTDVAFTATASAGSVVTNAKEKKATFTAPTDAGKVTIVFKATKDGFSQSTSVEVTVTAKAG